MGFSQKDGELAAQASNFAKVLAANPHVYQQTPETAAAVLAAVETFVASQQALEKARASGVRSEQMTATRNANRTQMLNLLRPIYLSAQASTAIRTSDKLALGIHIRSPRNVAHGPPTIAPLLSVLKVDGSVVTLLASDPTELGSKRLPAHVSGIAILSHAGEHPPASPNDFRFEAASGRTTVRLQMPLNVPPGGAVYYTCFYFNHRKEAGPACAPVRATVGAGSSMPAFKLAGFKLAA